MIDTWLAIRGGDHRPGLASVDLPALVLHGADDVESPPSHATWLQHGLPNARLVSFAGIGHNLPTDASDRVAEEIRRFVA